MSAKRKVLCAVLTLVTSAFLAWIFSNSLKDAAEYSAQSGTVLAFVQKILDALTGGALVVSSHVIRKLAHFSEYAMLGALLSFTYRAYTSGKKKVFIPALVGFLSPFIDEGLQFFADGRAPMLSDVAIDLAGVVAGVLFAMIVFSLARRIARRREKGGAVPSLAGASGDTEPTDLPPEDREGKAEGQRTSGRMKPEHRQSRKGNE